MAEHRTPEGTYVDQVRISVTKILCDPGTVRIKFDIIAYTDGGAMHFGFVRFMAMVKERDSVPKTRKQWAAILKQEHRAAWERYHKYIEGTNS